MGRRRPARRSCTGRDRPRRPTAPKEPASAGFRDSHRPDQHWCSWSLDSYACFKAQVRRLDVSSLLAYWRAGLSTAPSVLLSRPSQSAAPGICRRLGDPEDADTTARVGSASSASTRSTLSAIGATATDPLQRSLLRRRCSNGSSACRGNRNRGRSQSAHHPRAVTGFESRPSSESEATWP